MRILFITSTRIGDAVLSAGLLAHLVERYPDARLTIACGPAAAPLFAAVPNLDRVIPVVKHRYGLHWLRLWLTCAPRFWSLVVDLRRSAFAYTLLARRRRIVGRTRPGVHKLRQIAQTLDLMEPPAPRLWTAAAHEQAAARLIPKGGGAGRRGRTDRQLARQAMAGRQFRRADRAPHRAQGPVPQRARRDLRRGRRARPGTAGHRIGAAQPAP
jgi:lipopolysaccharide export system permease protein